MLKAMVNEARFTLRLEAVGPILVKSGHATLDGPDMAPVRTYRHGEWQYYLPGSSLKGVVRSHLEKIIRTLKPGVACNPFLRSPDWNTTFADVSCGAKFKARKRGAGKDNDPASIYADSCPVCRIFGSTGFIGRAAFSDAYVAPGSTISTELRDGVGINRMTGGAANGAKFDLQAVSSGAVFTAEVALRNFECWQLGALLLLVSDFEDGLIRIGSGRSRGLGAIRGTIESGTLSIHTLGVPSDQPATAVWGIGRVLDHQRYGTRSDDVVTTQAIPDRTRLGVRVVTTYRDAALRELHDATTAAFVARIEQWVTPRAMAQDSSRPNSGGARNG